MVRVDTTLVAKGAAMGAAMGGSDEAGVGGGNGEGDEDGYVLQRNKLDVMMV
jgi:hypothetical protein